MPVIRRCFSSIINHSDSNKKRLLLSITFATSSLLAKKNIFSTLLAEASVVENNGVKYDEISNTTARRLIKFWPYALLFSSHRRLPKSAVRTSQPRAILAYLIALAPVAAIQARELESIKISLNPQILALMPALTMEEKISESLFFVLPAFCQEYTYRKIAFKQLLDIHKLSVPTAAILSGILFSIEHIPRHTDADTHTETNINSFLRWAVLGTCFALATRYHSYSIKPALLSHLLLNAPRCAQPFLRQSYRGAKHEK